MRTFMPVHALWSRFIHIIFPDICFGCDRIGTALCASCTNDLLRHPAKHACAYCDQHVAHGICRRHAQKTGISRILALTSYAHPTARKLIEGNKYLGIARAPRVMGDLLTLLLNDLPFTPNVIIPIPSSRARARTRGGSHILPIAEILAQKLSLPVSQNALRRIKHTTPLARTHSPKERARILRGALHATTLRGARVLLIDDVVTSGATLHEAARTLRASGASEIAAVVFAKA